MTRRGNVLAFERTAATDRRERKRADRAALKERACLLTEVLAVCTCPELRPQLFGMSTTGLHVVAERYGLRSTPEQYQPGYVAELVETIAEMQREESRR